MVRQNEDWVLRSFEFRTPFFKASDNREEFLIVNLVIILDRGVLFRKEGYRVEDILFVVLREYSSGDEVRGIGFDDYLLSLVERTKS